MAAEPRSRWRNCAREVDSEILEIDAMEDSIAPLDPETSKIRDLISSLELCHHKAARWVDNIVEAIGAGQTDKRLLGRPPGRRHPAERVWEDACAALTAWCAGCPGRSLDMSVGGQRASRLLDLVGERSRLKEWQVQRVTERIRSVLHWTRTGGSPATPYVAILEAGSEYESALRTECPEQFREHRDFWLLTVNTVVHDTENGEPAKVSLGLAIDMLMPCHWNFPENLGIVLAAIGGALSPDRPFAACARNITLSPLRGRMKVVSGTLGTFSGRPGPREDVDDRMLALLGEPSADRKWLAASLDKTIRLQLRL